MPIFSKGAGPGSYWHQHDARLTGFTSRAQGIAASHDRLIHHVTKGTTNTPYISLSRSFGIARDYAINNGRADSVATDEEPGYVYEVELSAGTLPLGLVVLDPVKEVAKNAPEPLASLHYQHNGEKNFLIGVVDPAGRRKFLTAHYLQPPPATGTPRAALLTPELECLVRALRDAEIVIVGTIPASVIVNRYPVA